MFAGFDPKLLDDPEFKEDSVREEIVTPILKRLGYSASGPHRIVRSKALLHPFVMIGSKKHPISIIPDYLLYTEQRPALVLDAKRPSANLIKSEHAEQAYSYAIHPEVRVRYYALCSGRQLVAYDIYGIAPIFAIEYANIERDWRIIESVLSPQNVAHAPQRFFAPDFGIAVVKMGSAPGCQWLFPFTKLSHFWRVDESLYTTSGTFSIAGVDYLASFDIPSDVFMRLLDSTDADNRNHLLELLVVGHGGYAKRPICASLDTVIGKPTQGQDDVFIPFLVSDAKPLDEELFALAEEMLDEDEAT